MKALKLGNIYSREDVHSIFSSHTTFTPQAGTWGLQGIVRIPGRDKDYVFFVTYGQEQGDHEFDEGITDDGVLSWQSQPSQGLENPKVREFIDHNDLENNIYLFLRKESGIPYTYKGRLAYLSHDESREKPVYFQWQLMDWDNQQDGSSYESVPAVVKEEIDPAARGVLSLSQEMPKPKKVGVTKDQFRAKKSPDFGERDAANRKLGLLAENIVFETEKKRLVEIGRSDLAEGVVHTSVVEGDGAGYDIQSFSDDGEIIFIEVKATRGGINSAFYISPNELRFSLLNEAQYRIYRLFEVDTKSGDAKFYILRGSVAERCDLEATGYRASIKI